MFYSQFILAKKGPLGTIWIAAHLERKLRKNQVADTDIGVSVDSILFPDVPIALRLSSHLLLGVVRIYSRKVNYLFDDCSDTLLKIKQAFRSTAVDLPPEESTAPYHSITLPETFDLDDFELPDNVVFQGNYVDHHISTKEQITLQDTMDGVVYSTSQFGLDERFGDGDASQIGLDLDEELFLEKLAAPGDGDMLNSNADPQTSFQPITPFEEGENDEEMNQTSPAMAASVDGYQDCAEAPSTPGLVQEPILCNVQKLLACDDHAETEDINPKDLEGGRFVGTVVGNSDHHEDNEDLQMTLDATPEKNGYDLDGEEIQHLKQKVDLPATSENLEHLENGALINKEANVDLSPRFSCKASQEVNCYKQSADEIVTEKFSSRRTTLTVSEGIPVDDQTVQTEVNSVEVAENVDKSSGPRNTLSPNAFCSFVPAETEAIVEDQAFYKSKDCKTLETDEDIASPRVHVLQRCNSGLRPKKISLGGDSSVPPSDITNDTDMPCSLKTSEMDEAVIASGMASEMQGQNCDPILTFIVVPSVEEKLTPEMNPSEDMETDRRNLDAVPEDQSELPNSSTVSELPAPEKLLSMPEVPGNLLNEFLVEITPDKMVSVEREGDGTESRIKQGKKRSFTESTPTLQSHNADGSLTNAQSKRTAEFIPDDDDLLSSILVGRKSSILKLKATPTVTEVVPRKRPRIAPRASSSASKRKVLMDESMVLHGDTIRQQLTSTEDIRRVRKKAPATRHEVWIIEKQFLEEEVFYEPIFTGMTIDLIALHSEAYDLNNIKIIINENISDVDSVKKAELAGRPNVKKGKEREATEISLVRIDEEAQPAEIPVLDDNQQGANSSIGLRENEVQLQTDDISADIELRIPNHEHCEIADVEVDGASVDVADEAGCTVSHGLEYPCPSVHVDAPLSVDEDASVLDLRNGEDINDVHFREIPSDDILEYETEPGAKGEQLVKGAEDYEAYEARADCFTGSSQLTDDPELSITTTPLDTGVWKELILASNPSIEEIANGEPEFVKHRDGATEVELDGNTACDMMKCKDPKGDSLHLEGSYVKNTSLDCAQSTLLGDIERPSYLEAEVHEIMDPETSGLNHSLFQDQGGIGTTMGEHDTEFLNVDDDDIAEDDDYIPSAEETRHLENSGWSSRSRAVAKYLQTVFDKETELGKKVIPMDNLLSGKTRKEASRMFFETLVLKTRDYIHVEQPTPFNNINIKPRGKLMKMDF